MGHVMLPVASAHAEYYVDKHRVVTVTTYGVRKSRKARSGKENRSPSSSLSKTKMFELPSLPSGMSAT